MYSIEILEASVVRLCQLNELTTFLSPWIIFVPATRLAGKIHPAAFALIYAIVEQSLTFGCYSLGWHPLIAISQVALLELIAGFISPPVERRRSLSPGKAVAMQTSTTFNRKPDNSFKSECLLSAAHTAIRTSNWKTGGHRDKLDEVPWEFLLANLATAWGNGALVLYAQILQAPSQLQQSSTIRMVDLSEVFLLLLYRLLPFFRWRRRIQTSGFVKNWRSLIVPLYSQAILLSVRALFRWGFGFSALLGLKLLGSVEAEEAFGLQNYRRKENDSPISGWLSWELSILTLLLLGLREVVDYREANRA